MCNAGTCSIVRFIGKSEVVIEPENLPSKNIHLSNVREVWLGCGSYDNPKDYKDSYVGNVVLIRQNRICYIVGNYIQKFMLRRRERIFKFLSTVGNSGVPYGYMITDSRYILFNTNNCATDGYILKKELDMLVKKLSPEVRKKLQLSCLDTSIIDTHPMKFIDVLAFKV